ncbi:MAG: Rab family GTPase, partial [Thermosynechococcaceae cyanobacterium]
MVGAFATGKTSLVSQFVRGIYSEKYQTTVGVKIDKIVVKIEDSIVNLILWDIHGEDEFQKIRISYLRGASGYILVVDGTRRETLDKAISLHHEIKKEIGAVPVVMMLNKSDLNDEWELDDAVMEQLSQEHDWTAIKSSAKSGLGVEDCFHLLAHQTLDA